MVLDIIIILIFVISALRGKAKGLGESVIRLGALVLSVWLGVKFMHPVASYLRMTTLDELLHEQLLRIAETESFNLADVLPRRISALVTVLGGDRELEVNWCVDSLMLVIAFVLIMTAVWIVASWLRRSLRRSREEGGFMGTVDAAAGLLFGAARGALIVCLLLALMLPFTGLFMPDKIPVIHENLDHSIIAGYLYDNNPIFSLIHKLPL